MYRVLTDGLDLRAARYWVFVRIIRGWSLRFPL